MKTILQQFLTTDNIIFLQSTERFNAIHELCKHLKLEAVEPQILHREQIQSTAVGNHVAIPHVKNNDIRDIRVALGVSITGIPWKALDQLPVHLVFMVVSPLNRNREYLHLLAGIVRNFRDPERIRELLSLETPQALLPELQKLLAQTSK